MLITKAINKYGIANFKLYIIEYTEEHNLLNREQFWIDTLKPFSNICL